MKKAIVIAFLFLAIVLGWYYVAHGQVVAGQAGQPIKVISAAATLSPLDCGNQIVTTAGLDTFSITLPLAANVPGCAYKISNIAANGAVLLDISPNAADGIKGGCTLAASVVSFSGTADADIGLTKATGLIGDTITLTACAATTWCVSACQGIWANN